MYSLKKLEFLVAHPLDDLDLAVEARGATLNQWHAGRQTHFVDMAARIHIVERVEDETEGLKPHDVELGVLDVVVVCDDVNIGVELGSRLFRNLSGGQRMPSHVCGCSGCPTSAFDFLMCSLRNRNWRLRLLRSMVSRSTMWISPKPVRTRFLRSSQPMPPAPTIKTRDLDLVSHDWGFCCVGG